MLATVGTNLAVHQRTGRLIDAALRLRSHGLVRLGVIGCVCLLSLGLLAGCSNQTSAGQDPALSAPNVPTPISVPSSQRLILKARGVGVQIYACRANPAQPGGTQTYGWTLKAPEAALLDARGMQIGKHYEGPTWQLNDGSTVAGVTQASIATPDGNGIPWLLLMAVRHNGAGILAPVSAIQRVDTVGGKAPPTGCDAGAQDSEIRVQYEATYYFYGDKA